MRKIVAIYGSPRRKGNTSTLLDQAVQGALEAGAEVEKIYLQDLNMSPCLEIYGCKELGCCVIEDDFQKIHDQLMACQGDGVDSANFYADPARDGPGNNSVLAVDPVASFGFLSLAAPAAYGFLTAPDPGATITVQGSNLSISSQRSLILPLIRTCWSVAKLSLKVERNTQHRPGGFTSRPLPHLANSRRYQASLSQMRPHSSPFRIIRSPRRRPHRLHHMG